MFLVDAEDLTRQNRQPIEDGKCEKCLCKRERYYLTLFMESGAIHYVPLPFLVVIYVPT
jgi:hypothetical protein